MSALVEVRSPAAKAETKVAGWLVNQFVGGALSKAGGYALDQALALIGLKPDDETNKRLDKIQEGIDEILRDVKAIRAQLDALVQQLSLSTQEIILAIGESVIKPARAAIDAAYGTGATHLKGPGTVTSLGEAIRLRRAGQEVDTKAFAQNVIGTWNLHTHIVTIAEVVGSPKTATSTPLLQGWTEYLIAKNRGNMVKSAVTIYLTLESYFQELLETQFKGIGLMIAAKCEDVSIKEPETAKVRAQAYLADLAPKITAQADLFARCADEIILAILTDAPTRWLYSPWDTVPAEIMETIARRANLMRTIVRSAIGAGPATQTISGIHGTVIGRIVDGDTDAARSYTPKGYAASKGDAIGALAPESFPIEWEPTTDNKYAKLREKSKSGFRAFHYYWPFPATQPKAGEPIDSSFHGGLTPQWYDLDTFEKVDKGGDNTVLVADFCDMRYRRGALFSNTQDADGATVSSPAGTAATNTNQNRSGFRTNESRGIHALRAEESMNRLLAKGTLEGHMNYHAPQGGPVGYELTFPLFRYNGSASTIELAMNLNLGLELFDNVWPHSKRDGWAYMYMRPRGTISLLRQGDGESTMIPLYDTDNGHNLWQQGTGAQASDRRIFSTSAALRTTGGKEDTYSLVLGFSIVNELHTWGTATDPGGWAKGRITYELSGFRLAWK